MEKAILFLSWGILCAPFLSAVGVLSSTYLQKSGAKKNIYKISVFFNLVYLLLSFILLILFFSNHTNLDFYTNKIFSLYLTPLNVIILFYVSIVSLVIHTFSIKYMFDEEGYSRYFILLDIMIFVIFGLLLSGNILAIAFFWHLMGIVLYFQLIHNFKKEQCFRYSFYTFFTHLFADIPLLIATYMIYKFYHTLDLKIFLDTVSNHTTTFLLFNEEVSVASVIALLIIASAIIKSSGFPFHIWLPYTLEGPTPISALMHAGIVNAGAFLANRFAPLFLQGEISLHLILVIGFITAIIGSASMMIQNDIKKALAYSTVGQMGYMMLEIGSGAFTLAIYHMMVHGIFKATLFLGSGGVISEARNSPNLSSGRIVGFLFPSLKENNPTIFEYIFFTIFVPMLIAFLLFFSSLQGSYYQSSVLFYMFAWVSGSQVVYTMYSTHKRLKAILVSSIGFCLTLFLYIFMEHFFEGILYFDNQLVTSIFKAASWEKGNFYILYGIITATVLLTWIVAYQKLAFKKSLYTNFGSLYSFTYKVFSREFYILDIFGTLSNKLIKISAKINKKVKY